MEKHLDNLMKSIFFKDVDRNIIKDIFFTLPYIINNYDKDEIIAMEGDDCYNLGIILSGNVEIHKPFPSGKVVTINNFEEGNVFGEALVFSGTHKYPATIVASTESEILYIDKLNISKLMKSNDKILNNFVSILSNRILMLNDRITNLSYDTVRKKIASVILVEYSKQKNRYLILPFCRRKMAELLNIPRPSLSRELMKMKEERIIDYHRNNLKIVDLLALEECLLK